MPHDIPAQPAKADDAGPAPTQSLKQSSAAKILVGLALGAVLGVTANLTAGGSAALEGLVRYVTEPAGRIWLRALIMIVVPLVFATLSLGVAKLATMHRLGRIGL